MHVHGKVTFSRWNRDEFHVGGGGHFNFLKCVQVQHYESMEAVTPFYLAQKSKICNLNKYTWFMIVD